MDYLRMLLRAGPQVQGKVKSAMRVRPTSLASRKDKEFKTMNEHHSYSGKSGLTFREFTVLSVIFTIIKRRS